LVEDDFAEEKGVMDDIGERIKNKYKEKTDFEEETFTRLR
jgi:hypothetical protein